MKRKSDGSLTTGTSALLIATVAMLAISVLSLFFLAYNIGFSERIVFAKNVLLGDAHLNTIEGLVKEQEVEVRQLLNEFSQWKTRQQAYTIQSATPKTIKDPQSDVWAVRPMNDYYLEKINDTSCGASDRKILDEVVNTAWKFTEGAVKYSELEGLQHLRSQSRCTLLQDVWAILLTLTDEKSAEQFFQEHPPETAKALLYAGILNEETYHNDNADKLYREARELNPSITKDYFGILSSDFNSALRLVFHRSNPAFPKHAASKVLKETMNQLLLIKEFARYGIGSSEITYDEARNLQKNAGAVIKNMIDPIPLKIMQKFYKTLVQEGHLPYNDTQANRYYLYNDAVSRFIGSQLAPLVSRIADEPVKFSYSYLVAYTAASDLAAHLDRAQCYYTLTLQIDMDPPSYIWPFGFGEKVLSPSELMNPKITTSVPKHPNWAFLRPGDGGLIRGSHTVHFRKALPAGHTSYNLFLHFVQEDFSDSLD